MVALSVILWPASTIKPRDRVTDAKLESSPHTKQATTGQPLRYIGKRKGELENDQAER